jgi:hypothetical protein
MFRGKEKTDDGAMDYKRNCYRVITKETSEANCIFKRAVKN